MSRAQKPAFTKKSSAETHAPALRQAVIRKLPHRIAAKAEVLLPPVPGLVDHYVEGLAATWASLGRPFSSTDLASLRVALARMLREAFESSPHSRVCVAYQTDPPPQLTLRWNLSIRHSSLEAEFTEWVATRNPPLFGQHPDAKVVDVARSLGTPATVSVLDVGAGTGRNTLPLAREGFAADAVELTSALSDVLRAEVASEGLSVKVFQGDILDESLGIPTGHYRLLFMSEVVSHFRTTRELRSVFETAKRVLAPGGTLLFNCFLNKDASYKPDDTAREMAQVMWCSLFTRRELEEAADGLGLSLLSDESTPGYEKAHLPATHWPPTGWYEAWTSGGDLFDLPPHRSPVEMRWLAYRKGGPAPDEPA